MAKYEVYANVMQLHKIVVNANSVAEAQEKAENLFSDKTCYETDYVEINTIYKVKGGK